MKEPNSEWEGLNSFKLELVNFEENGIKEQEFSQIFKYEPIYTLY